MGGRLLDYIAQGAAANLPDPAGMPDLIATGAAALYYANDTKILYGFNGDTALWDVIGVGELASLTDVDVVTTPPTDGQVLVWNGVAGKWEPASQSGGLTVARNCSDTTESTTTHASKGTIFAPVAPVVVRGIIPRWTAIAGHDYAGYLLEIDLIALTVTTVLGSAVLSGLAAGDQYALFDFGAPVSLELGKTYATLLQDRSGATGTAALGILGATNNVNVSVYSGLALKQVDCIFIDQTTEVIAGTAFARGNNLVYWIDILGSVVLS